MTKTLTLLGIETSCDETAAAVVRRHGDEPNAGASAGPGAGPGAGKGEILSNVIFSQIKEHTPFGGVVPEIAARAHVEHLDGLIARALNEASLGWDELDGIAVTAGPGLIGGVIVGLMTAKGIALARGLPLIAVNHLEGHALTARLTNEAAFPYLLLLVSGGHSQLLIVKGVGQYQRLGTTIDDAVGEAFDKIAKLMDLGFPGGPAVEKIAREGNPDRFTLPRPLFGKPGCDFSFSGLKTAVRQLALAQETLDHQTKADIAAAFQVAVGDVIADRVTHAIKMTQEISGETSGRLVVAGGVAANLALRTRLQTTAAEHNYALIVPPPRLCTDNGVMIAWAGAEKLALGQTSDLNVSPLARWPLDPTKPARGN